jgi:hypothetical protein
MVGLSKEGQVRVSQSHVRTLVLLRGLWIVWAVISLNPEISSRGWRKGVESVETPGRRAAIFVPMGEGGWGSQDMAIAATFCHVLAIKVISPLPRAGNKARTARLLCQAVRAQHLG